MDSFLNHCQFYSNFVSSQLATVNDTDLINFGYDVKFAVCRLHDKNANWPTACDRGESSSKPRREMLIPSFWHCLWLRDRHNCQLWTCLTVTTQDHRLRPETKDIAVFLFPLRCWRSHTVQLPQPFYSLERIIIQNRKEEKLKQTHLQRSCVSLKMTHKNRFLTDRISQNHDTQCRN